jgi:hypothetical protein
MFFALLCLAPAGMAAPQPAHTVAAQPSHAQPAQANCPTAFCTFLPLMLVQPIVPLLNEPAEGAQIVTLAPILTWTPTISSTYHVQVSADPSFATTEVNAMRSWRDPLPNPAFHITGSNLKVATIYYWRVGVRYEGSYQYTPVRMFATPAAQPLLPSPPALVAPPNAATLPALEVTLSWQAVPGALFYRARVWSPDSTIFDSEIVPASALSYQVQKPLVPGATYTWRVRTFDQYGWGIFGETWSFTAP